MKDKLEQVRQRASDCLREWNAYPDELPKYVTDRWKDDFRFIWKTMDNLLSELKDDNPYPRKL